MCRIFKKLSTNSFSGINLRGWQTTNGHYLAQAAQSLSPTAYAIICANNCNCSIFIMNDCMPWPIPDFYAWVLHDTCVYSLPAVKKDVVFCCMDCRTKYTPALITHKQHRRANLPSWKCWQEAQHTAP